MIAACPQMDKPLHLLPRVKSSWSVQIVAPRSVRALVALAGLGFRSWCAPMDPKSSRVQAPIVQRMRAPSALMRAPPGPGQRPSASGRAWLCRRMAARSTCWRTKPAVLALGAATPPPRFGVASIVVALGKRSFLRGGSGLTLLPHPTVRLS